jgi:ubiquitin C-terminal hydrolase
MKKIYDFERTSPFTLVYMNTPSPARIKTKISRCMENEKVNIDTK